MGQPICLQPRARKASAPSFPGQDTVELTALWLERKITDERLFEEGRGWREGRALRPRRPERALVPVWESLIWRWGRACLTSPVVLPNGSGRQFWSEDTSPEAGASRAAVRASGPAAMR